MINQITVLETCWYISPPWDREIPKVSISLFEKVYLKNSRTFGYCCGVQWHKTKWSYAVDTEKEIISAWEYDLIGTGRLEPHTLTKPEFMLGERVMLRTLCESPKQRIVLGIEQLDDCWFYMIESMSPVLGKSIRTNNFTYVSQEDLVRVNV
ncbi:MAG: DUF1392 domain-containing protein [Desmonostoc vinosum HA7617-LM4]|jgi:hypothetical protein|nr:DUF1392 domain-containing protein [Desmonostoc vinosum HA7617-LM4]